MLRVCDALTGRILWQLTDLPASGQCVCYSPDGHWLATGDYDSGLVRIWDAHNGKRLPELGTNTAGLTFSVQFSPDGHWLAYEANDPNEAAKLLAEAELMDRHGLEVPYRLRC